MTKYFEYGVNLSEGQKTNLAKAIQTNSELTLRLKNNQLSGSDELMLTKTQLNKIQKAASNRTGVDLKISKSQIRKAVKQGGSLFSSLAMLGAKALPYVTKAASKALPALATGAVSALGSLGIDKIFGKGMTGGFLVPQNKIDELIQHKNLLTNAQKKQILAAVQSGGELVINPTTKQRGGFLGPLLASIGIPLALEMGSKLFGKGMTLPRKAGQGLMTMPKPPPPFYGNWEGRGKKKRPRATSRKKFPFSKYSIDRSNSLRPVWKDIPLSNLDLMDWIRYLQIPDFKGIFARDSVDHIHKTGSCVINLDDGVGKGTHWVASFIKSGVIYYFNSFSLPPPLEFVEYVRKLGMKYQYNYGHPIQNIYSVRCGYYCLYFLDNISRKSFYDCLKVFDLSETEKNEKFIKKYFV